MNNPKYPKLGDKAIIIAGLGMAFAITIFAVAYQNNLQLPSLTQLPVPGESPNLPTDIIPDAVPLLGTDEIIIRDDTSSVGEHLDIGSTIKAAYIDNNKLVRLQTYAFERINEDRAQPGKLCSSSFFTSGGGASSVCAEDSRAAVPTIAFSSNTAAQVHAEDILATRQISHWMTNGEKPHMTYSRLGGIGDVAQNVYIQGYDNIENCTSGAYYCPPIDPIEAIESGRYEMIYNDQQCCDNGHRDNILDIDHTHVSIGIAYDEYTFVLVQNFENNYLELNKPIEVNNYQVTLDAKVLKGTFDGFSVYYDPLPTPADYAEHRDDGFYDFGTVKASVVQPAGPGSYYTQPNDYILIEAQTWDNSNQNIVTSFDLTPAIKEPGVYTLLGWLKDSQGKDFTGFSYSIFVN